MEDPILNKAKEILAERKRTSIILSAGLCPKCGEKIEETWDEDSKYKHCSVNKEHYNVFLYDDDDDY